MSYICARDTLYLPRSLGEKKQVVDLFATAACKDVKTLSSMQNVSRHVGL